VNRSLKQFPFLLLASFAVASGLAAQPSAEKTKEPWSFHFDSRAWQLGHQEEDGQHSLREYFPPGQTRQDWSEKVTSYFDARTAPPQWLAGWVREDLTQNCIGARVEVLEETAESALLELSHEGCQNFIPLHELRLIMASPNGTLTLSYGERVKSLPTEKRANWLSILREAKPLAKNPS
jgi:hypothetical protein